ncbi:hypothetical protein BDD12DRAFT_34376 [Trichophaea hybrida]|nr:hypothetical protein BDD12DRAFT_34376 [Trichophaea hybrida]
MTAMFRLPATAYAVLCFFKLLLFWTNVHGFRFDTSGQRCEITESEERVMRRSRETLGMAEERKNFCLMSFMRASWADTSLTNF